jgi:hypothetical protein
MYRLSLTGTIIVTELVQSVSILVGLVSMMCSSRRFGRDRLRAFSEIRFTGVKSASYFHMVG